MALGTAIVILGVIWFCVVSPGFRRFFLWSSAVVIIGSAWFIQHELARNEPAKIQTISR